MRGAAGARRPPGTGVPERSNTGRRGEMETMHFESDKQTEPDTQLALRFRPVTSETMGDFVLFRSTHSQFGSCSCMRWRMRNAQFTRSTRRARAGAFDALVEEDIPVGILAYLNDTPVAWCSVAPRQTFKGLKRGGRDEARTWSVTCFWVDPLYRRKGITVRLLMAAVEYARSAGAKIIEGYPVEPGKSSRGSPGGSVGSLSTFRRAGFREESAPGRRQRVMHNIVG